MPILRRTKPTRGGFKRAARSGIVVTSSSSPHSDGTQQDSTYQTQPASFIADRPMMIYHIHGTKGSWEEVADYDLDIDKEDESTWPDANVSLSCHLIGKLVEAGISSITLNRNWPKIFGQNGQILAGRVPVGHPFIVRTGLRQVYAIYKSAYILCGGDGISSYEPRSWLTGQKSKKIDGMKITATIDAGPRRGEMCYPIKDTPLSPLIKSDSPRFGSTEPYFDSINHQFAISAAELEREQGTSLSPSRPSKRVKRSKGEDRIEVQGQIGAPQTGSVPSFTSMNKPTSISRSTITKPPITSPVPPTTDEQRLRLTTPDGASSFGVDLVEVMQPHAPETQKETLALRKLKALEMALEDLDGTLLSNIHEVKEIAKLDSKAVIAMKINEIITSTHTARIQGLNLLQRYPRTLTRVTHHGGTKSLFTEYQTHGTLHDDDLIPYTKEKREGLR
ncbi:MAG: hypothetical protein Q9220_000127 [cf. Caloplaca sp. 1 TL-2023]